MSEKEKKMAQRDAKAYENFLKEVAGERGIGYVLKLGKIEKNIIDDLINSVCLRGRDKEAMFLYFGLHGRKVNCTEIGKIFNVSRTTIDNQIKKTMQRLRCPFRLRHMSRFFSEGIRIKNIEDYNFDDIDLPTLVKHTLFNIGIKNVDDLVKKSPQELIRAERMGRGSGMGIGRKSVEYIIRQLELNGLYLR